MTEKIGVKTVAYIGNFGFPDKNASGKRVLGNCKVLQELEYRVICIGPGRDETKEYDGIKLYSVSVGNGFQRVLRNKISEVEDIISNEKIEIVFLYGALFTQKENLQLIKWCKKQNIKVYYDQVDWLDLNWHNPLRGLVRARNYNLLNNKVIPLCDGVICISRYLLNIHSKNGKKTVIIPPLAVEKSEGLAKGYKAQNTIHFVYAGTTSDVNRPICQWKDRIDIMFEKLNECITDDSLRPFILDIYGMTEYQYIRMFPEAERVAGCQIIKGLEEKVIFHGTVPNLLVMDEIRKADFTILIRDKKRATMSGFPTKVSESITCGTPVLCNDTSDIKEYVEDGKTGFVMDDILAMFKKVLSLDSKSIIAMKSACGENPFYYKKYVGRLKRFLEG